MEKIQTKLSENSPVFLDFPSNFLIINKYLKCSIFYLFIKCLTIASRDAFK